MTNKLLDSLSILSLTQLGYIGPQEPASQSCKGAASATVAAKLIHQAACTYSPDKFAIMMKILAQPNSETAARLVLAAMVLLYAQGDLMRSCDDFQMVCLHNSVTIC